MVRSRPPFASLRGLLAAIASSAVALAALAAIASCIAAAAGIVPWLSIPAQLGGAPAPWLGMLLQIGAAIVLLAVAATLPALWRVGRLEAAHRSFAMGMEDVARAYQVSHAADRAGVYRMKSEFDAVRERIAHLREHPDLAGLEPEVLELAAQMSTQTRRIAETYSDDAVGRARRFLEQRQEEVERAREAIAKAHHSARELKRWTEAVELEEQVVDSQLQRLDEDLEDLLPRLGYRRAGAASNIVPLPYHAAE